MNWMLREIRRYQLPLLALIVFAAIFYLPGLLMGRVFYWGLPVLQFYPWRAAAVDAISHGALPLWNSSSGMGAPLLANYQLAFFYPPTWVIYLFGRVGGVQWMAWSHALVNLVHFFITGLGMAKLLEKHSSSPLAQSIGALAYSACGFFIARQGVFPIIWTAAWLPWLALYASDLASPFKKLDTLHCAGWIHPKLTLVIAMLLLAGHAQLSWYFLWFAGAWIAAGRLLHSQNPFRSIIRYVLSGLLAAGIAAIQLIPTAEYLLQSQRASAVDFETAAAYSFWPWRWITLLAPNFFGNPGTGDYWGYASFWEDAVYIGILPLSLAVFSLVSLLGRKVQPSKPGRVAAWVGIALTAIFAMGKFTPVYSWLYQHIPSIDMFHAPTRMMVIAVFMLVFMGTQYADSGWTRPSGRALYWSRLATAGCVAVSIGSLAGWALLEDINPTFFRSSALAGLAATGIGFLTLYQPTKETLARKRWELAVVGLLVIDLWLAQIGSAPTLPMAELRFSSFAGAIGGVNGRLFVSAEDEQWLRHKRFYRFQDFRFLEPAETVFRVPIANTNLLLGYSSVSNFDPLVSMRYQAWMDRLAGEDEKALEADWARMGVTHRLVRNVGEDEVLIQPVGVDSSFPGARMTARVLAAGDEVEALEILKEHGTDASIVVFEKAEINDLASTNSGKPFAYEILAFERSWNRFIIEYQSEQDGYLVAAESYFPGWTASVDGLAAKVYPADGVFMGIQAPAGQHRVEFMYQPDSIRAGWIVTVLSLVALTAILIVGWRKHSDSHTAS